MRSIALRISASSDSRVRAPNSLRRAFSFADERLLHIMEGPDAVASYRLAGVRLGRDAQYSSKERDRFRWKGLTVPTALRDGSVLFPPGGGYMSNRLSIEGRIRGDRLLTQAHSLEEQCRTKAEAIKDEVERLSGRALANVSCSHSNCATQRRASSESQVTTFSTASTRTGPTMS